VPSSPGWPSGHAATTSRLPAHAQLAASALQKDIRLPSRPARRCPPGRRGGQEDRQASLPIVFEISSSTAHYDKWRANDPGRHSTSSELGIDDAIAAIACSARSVNPSAATGAGHPARTARRRLTALLAEPGAVRRAGLEPCPRVHG
jgi:hypothetical protein